MKAGHMAMQAYQIGPIDTAPLAWDCLTQSASAANSKRLLQLHSPISIHSCGVVGC